MVRTDLHGSGRIEIRALATVCVVAKGNQQQGFHPIVMPLVLSQIVPQSPGVAMIEERYGPETLDAGLARLSEGAEHPIAKWKRESRLLPVHDFRKKKVTDRVAENSLRRPAVL